MEEQPLTIIVDPRGDLKLLVESEDKKTKRTRIYVVSASVMCIASPVWCAMFDPEGRWAIASSNSKECFRMLEDDPDALLLLLDIAHLNFDRMPASLSFDRLLNVAILCDKYDIVKLVCPVSVRKIRFP